MIVPHSDRPPRDTPPDFRCGWRELPCGPRPSQLYSPQRSQPYGASSPRGHTASEFSVRRTRSTLLRSHAGGGFLVPKCGSCERSSGSAPKTDPIGRLRPATVWYIVVCCKSLNSSLAVRSAAFRVSVGLLSLTRSCVDLLMH